MDGGGGWDGMVGVLYNTAIIELCYEFELL